MNCQPASLALSLLLGFALPATATPATPAAPAVPLATSPAQAAGAGAHSAFDGVVQAQRQAVLAAQVAGAVVMLAVRPGERVAAGQVLLRLDARAAEQGALAAQAQATAAQAALAVAAKDLQRQKLLFEQHFISAAALDRAQAEFQAAQAQGQAQQALAGAALAQSGLHTVRAPFAGLVAEVPVQLGDMAQPGRPLVTVYDPSALRITAHVPQSVAAQLAPGTPWRLELPGLPAAQAWPAPTRQQLLPTADASTHTVELRAELPPQPPGVAPGQFARLWLPLPAAAGAARVSVPLAAVVRRAEMTGLYVLGPGGKPLLRQVRLGRSEGGRVEVLAGLAAGEAVAADPQAAARQP